MTPLNILKQLLSYQITILQPKIHLNSSLTKIVYI